VNISKQECSTPHNHNSNNTTSTQSIETKNKGKEKATHHNRLINSNNPGSIRETLPKMEMKSPPVQLQ
jgi:hypothetical protein